MSERDGYLVVETQADHDGFVRVHATRHTPALPEGTSPDPTRPLLRYAAFFPSLHVATMHAQTALRRGMVDAEAGLYRTDPVTAIAAVEAIDLDHRRVFLDPTLAADPRLSMLIEQRRTRQLWTNRVWTAVGILAILLLILFAQIPVF